MSGSRPKIVAIVDDDRNLRTALQDLLESAGLRGEVYSSADEFIVRKGYLTSDFVLSDLRMPGISGIDLLRWLRDEGIDQPVIIMTSYPDADIAATAIQQGASAFLKKPLDSSELLSFLRADEL